MTIQTPPTGPTPSKGPRLRTVPQGDDRERLICPDCGYVAYTNPVVVVGAVVSDAAGRILLCRRGIQPRHGYWTLPAGFLELGETAEAGAAREAWEEAGARIRIDALLGLYDVPRIGQIQLFFRATLADPAIAAGAESLEVTLVPYADIPWRTLAFPSVVWALRTHATRIGQHGFAPQTNPTGAEADVELDGWTAVDV